MILTGFSVGDAELESFEELFEAGLGRLLVLGMFHGKWLEPNMIRFHAAVAGA